MHAETCMQADVTHGTYSIHALGRVYRAGVTSEGMDGEEAQAVSLCRPRNSTSAGTDQA